MLSWTPYSLICSLATSLFPWGRNIFCAHFGICHCQDLLAIRINRLKNEGILVKDLRHPKLLSSGLSDLCKLREWSWSKFTISEVWERLWLDCSEYGIFEAGMKGTRKGQEHLWDAVLGWKHAESFSDQVKTNRATSTVWCLLSGSCRPVNGQHILQLFEVRGTIAHPIAPISGPVQTQ